MSESSVGQGGNRAVGQGREQPLRSGHQAAQLADEDPAAGNDRDTGPDAEPAAAADRLVDRLSEDEEGAPEGPPLVRAATGNPPTAADLVPMTLQPKPEPSALRTLEDLAQAWSSLGSGLSAEALMELTMDQTVAALACGTWATDESTLLADRPLIEVEVRDARLALGGPVVTGNLPPAPGVELQASHPLDCLPAMGGRLPRGGTHSSPGHETLSFRGAGCHGAADPRPVWLLRGTCSAL